uniref:Acetyl-coenzyme A synthetase n=1 Tax=Candidatus Nitrotoga fabula TaxID=2182327 RepID=A0A2X0QW20_9PROT|nr:Acetyl-coenzyme A synthetase [Candidatus Nitrotoga fabula]
MPIHDPNQTDLHEASIYPPSDAFIRQANISGLDAYHAICREASEDYEGFWARLAREHIAWNQPFHTILNENDAPFYQWFEDGKLNVSYNCLDRHLTTHPEKTALIFEADDGEVTRVNYRELHARVCQFANALKSRNIQPGDRVIIYMPMSIEAVVAMQACARIGAIHSVVFGGFSSLSLNERIEDAQACAVITADGQFRGGKMLPLKTVIDEALGMGGCETVHSVIVYRRAGNEIPWNTKHDLWWHDLTTPHAFTCEPEWVGSEHPLFILYTSGSTGKPKGVQHSSGGYLLGAIISMQWVFDYKPSDIFWCTADVGWITGHSYVAYGPLAVGATQVIFEGVPTWPDAGRFWKMIQDHQVTTFYTAPTAIRALIKLGGDLPGQYNLSSLRLLGTVGEPINPAAWVWYYTQVGKSRCPVVDTWWQTETGCHMIAPLPGAVAAKPGSCTLPLPGILAAIVNENGERVQGQHKGFLVIQRPFPSQIRTIWGNDERYRKGYFPENMKGAYLAGDSAHQDEDGYFWIMGRIDDVLKVSGHRLGTREIEAVLASNPLVAEAAVVGKPHDIKGESIVAFVVLKGSRPGNAEAQQISDELRNWVGTHLGPIAKPDEIRFGDNLPKTRSGKIMRRLLRSIATGQKITQDTSTLENPAILDQLQETAQ